MAKSSTVALLPTCRSEAEAPFAAVRFLIAMADVAQQVQACQLGVLANVLVVHVFWWWLGDTPGRAVERLPMPCAIVLSFCYLIVALFFSQCGLFGWPQFEKQRGEYRDCVTL